MVNYVYFYAVKSNKLLIVEKTATSEDWPEQKIKACLLSTCFLRVPQEQRGVEGIVTAWLQLQGCRWKTSVGCVSTPLWLPLYI